MKLTPELMQNLTILFSCVLLFLLAGLFFYVLRLARSTPGARKKKQSAALPHVPPFQKAHGIPLNLLIPDSRIPKNYNAPRQEVDGEIETTQAVIKLIKNGDE